jgi:hypothetical protein
MGSHGFVKVRGSPCSGCVWACFRPHFPDLMPETNQTDKGRHGISVREIENFYVEIRIHAVHVELFEPAVSFIASCFERADAKWPC